jgi:hypothetical protein
LGAPAVDNRNLLPARFKADIRRGFKSPEQSSLVAGFSFAKRIGRSWAVRFA